MGEKSIINRNTFLVSFLLICLMAIGGVHSNSGIAHGHKRNMMKIFENYEAVKHNSINADKSDKLNLYKKHKRGRKPRPIVKQTADESEFNSDEVAEYDLVNP